MRMKKFSSFFQNRFLYLYFQYKSDYWIPKMQEYHWKTRIFMQEDSIMKVLILIDQYNCPENPHDRIVV